MTSEYNDRKQDAYLNASNLGYIEELLARQKAGEPIDPKWQQYLATTSESSDEVIDDLRQMYTQPKVAYGSSSGTSGQPMLDYYRRNGYRFAQLNPVGEAKAHQVPLAQFGLSADDEVEADGQLQSVSALQAKIEKAYCGQISLSHNPDAEDSQWLFKAYEAALETPLSTEDQKTLLTYLMHTEGWEHYLNRKYVGQKRFAVEGLDAMIPMLKMMIHTGVLEHQVDTVLLGAAHRGRLNMMINVAGMPTKTILDIFDHKDPTVHRSGDVKYHLGYAASHRLEDKRYEVHLGYNPSHLEFIYPVTLGTARHKQDKRDDKRAVVPVVVHGDTAFSGQGVVSESLNMTYTEAYYVQGCIHVMANNQIGFTTNPSDARSGSEVAATKMLDIPVLHVNADAPEAVVKAGRLAIAYRQRFGRSIMINLVGYRRFGHNEADEPMFTQPELYLKIKAHKTCYQQYKEQLINAGVVTAEELEQQDAEMQDILSRGERFAEVEEEIQQQDLNYSEDELVQELTKELPTGVDQAMIDDYQASYEKSLQGMTLHRQIEKIAAQQQKMFAGEVDFNWGTAENLAYASLIHAGIHIRFTGQDVQRGTFSHRHSIVLDQKTAQAVMPLADYAATHHTRFYLHNSTLSEQAVVGYEYGYSIENTRDQLVIWEAQFGDFANGAQVMIDQFVASSYQKWGIQNALVMLLPHGFEGMGPEHSSARIERFLQLAAQNNLNIALPTTPAQMFHLLRRHMLRKSRNPLVVFTPKSFLRHPRATSSLATITSGSFQPLIVQAAKTVKRLLFCAGKVFYDLQEAMAENDQVAVIRVEQLYPLSNACADILKKYAKVKDIIWCQEEPQNQGCWHYMQAELAQYLQPGQHLSYIGRPAAASPATGSATIHKQEQQQLIAAALNHD